MKKAKKKKNHLNLICLKVFTKITNYKKYLKLYYQRIRQMLSDIIINLTVKLKLNYSD